MATDERKKSLYLHNNVLREVREEANRQDRTISWLIQRAWKLAKDEIKKLPSVETFDAADR